VSELDPALVREVSRRFGRPAEWRPVVRLTEHDRSVLALGGPTRRHDVTFTVRDGRGQVAVIRKPSFPPGAWRIPSGGVKPGEPFDAGVAREALEETGLTIELAGYPLVARARFLDPAGEELRWTTYVVLARALAGTRLEPRDRVEIDDARWMTMAELTGPVAAVLRAGPGGLFRYRADLHDRIAGLLETRPARTLEG
jgi:ADP-ribose pyrophosphatase YjhB (NUDIX family)